MVYISNVKKVKICFIFIEKNIVFSYEENEIYI